MAVAIHTTTPHAFANAVPVAAPDLQPETVAMLAALLDPPGTKRRGTIRALVVRHVPKLGSVDLGPSAVIA